MNRRNICWIVTLCILCVVLCSLIRWHATASPQEKPMQIWGCSVTRRDLSVYQGEKDNIAKGVWKKNDQETLDEIAVDSDLGLHICLASDPNTGKRFVVAFDGTGYQGHISVSIVEESK